MALNITKATDTIEVGALKMLIYGQPGSGKTSMAFTAKNPLMLDFDNGSHRSGYRKDAVLIKSWSEVAAIDPSDLEGYDTLILDTVGRALDFLAADLIKDNPKLGYNGALTLQGYGALKGAFAQWIKTHSTMGKDIVMIAHDKEDKKGDNMIIRPDITGGSYHEVFKIADGVAYLQVLNKKRVLDFSPTEAYVGKNPANFDPIEVPHFSKEPDFLADLVDDTRGRIGQMSAEAQEIVKQVDAVRGKVEKIKTADKMNELLAEVNQLEGPAKIQSKGLMNARVKELGMEYNQEQGFHFPAPEGDVDETVSNVA